MIVLGFMSVDGTWCDGFWSALFFRSWDYVTVEHYQ